MEKKFENVEVVESFDAFDEIEEIVTASEKGTLVCCF